MLIKKMQRWCIGLVACIFIHAAWGQVDLPATPLLDPAQVDASADALNERLQEMMEAYKPASQRDLPELFPKPQSDSAAMDGMQTADWFGDFLNCLITLFFTHRDCNAIKREGEEAQRQAEANRQEAARQEAARQEAQRQEAARQEEARKEAERVKEVARKKKADAEADRDRLKRRTWKEIR